MVATRKKIVQSEEVSEEKIIALYMDCVLTNTENTKNVYMFCKNNEIDESVFYSFFGSFEHIRQVIWLKFFENAVTAISAEKAYKTYTDKDKLLTLFYTLFEILTLNRSYVLATLDHEKYHLKQLKDLALFRNEFRKFVEDLISQNVNLAGDRMGQIRKSVLSEGAWIQFLFLLKFWMEDHSKGFEKTDIAIEKSVTTATEIFDMKPLESLVDFGKFLWKERMMKA